MDMSNVEMKFNKLNSSSCELVIKSEVEGIATTYASLYRRMLLQSTPCYSVAGIRCKANGKFVKNFFESVPNLTGSLIELNTILHNAKFDIVSEDKYIVLTLELKNKVMLSDLCDPAKTVVSHGSIQGFTLESKDEILATVAGEGDIVLDIFLMEGIGYSQKDVNTQALSNVLGSDAAKDWMITDSQHKGVHNVSYHNDVRLGKQTVKLVVTSHINGIEETIRSCTDTIINQLEEFKGCI